MAVRLGRYFATGPEFWAGLQMQHDLAAATRELDLRKIEPLASPSAPAAIPERVPAVRANRAEAAKAIVAANLLARTVLDFMAQRANETWQGTATNLLNAVEMVANEQAKKSHAWPKSPNSLSNKLRLAAPSLRKLGLVIDTEGRTPDHKRSRIITISEPYEGGGERSSGPSAEGFL